MFLKRARRNRFWLEDWQEKVIKNWVPSSIYDADMERRIRFYKKEMYATKLLRFDPFFRERHHVEDCDHHAPLWIIKYKYAMCAKKLRNEWITILVKEGIETIPVSDKELFKLVFSRPDYKDREARDKEEIIGTK